MSRSLALSLFPSLVLSLRLVYVGEYVRYVYFVAQGRISVQNGRHEVWYRIHRPMGLSSKKGAPLLVLHGGPQVPSDYHFDLAKVCHIVQREVDKRRTKDSVRARERERESA